MGNLLETNWSPSKLENLIILGSPMHDWDEIYVEQDYGIFKKTEMEQLMHDDRYRYMITIKDWSVDFTVDKESIERSFNQFYWVFFNLHPEFDMSYILPNNSFSIFSSDLFIYILLFFEFNYKLLFLYCRFPALNKIQVDHENAIPNDDDIR